MNRLTKVMAIIFTLCFISGLAIAQQNWLEPEKVDQALKLNGKLKDYAFWSSSRGEWIPICKLDTKNGTRENFEIRTLAELKSRYPDSLFANEDVLWFRDGSEYNKEIFRLTRVLLDKVALPREYKYSDKFSENDFYAVDEKKPNWKWVEKEVPTTKIEKTRVTAADKNVIVKVRKGKINIEKPKWKYRLEKK